MKNTTITTIFLLLLSTVSFAQTDGDVPKCGLPFASYDFQTSLNDEKAILYNLAIELKMQPELIGYIFVFTNKDESVNESKRRGNRIIKFLTKTVEKDYRVEKIRLVIAYRQTLDDSQIILRPVTKGFPAPNF